MVEGERDRHHQTRHKLFTIPHRFHRRLGHAEDSHFRRVDNRREVGSSQAADTGDSEATALHFASGKLTITRFFGDGSQFARQLSHTLLIHVFKDWNHQTIWRINRHADVDVFLQRQALTIFGQRAIEARHLLKRSGNRFHDEDNRGVFHIQFALLSFGVLLFTERFQIGDIGFVEVRNVRDHHPVTAQVRARDFLDTAQFHFFNFTKLTEVHFRPRQHAWNTAACCCRCSFRTLDSLFYVSLNVFAQDTTFTARAFHFRQVHAEFACQAANQRRRVNVSVVLSKFGFAFRFGSRRRSRFLSFCRWRGGSRFLFSRSGSRRCAFHFEDHNQRTGFHFVADADFDLFHGARERCRNFHRSLVAFYGDQRLFSFHFIADFHHHFGNFNFVAADIRYVNVFLASGCWRRSGFRFRRCCCTRFTCNVEDHDQRTGRHFVAGVNFDLFHGARERRRNFHRGFITFYGDQRLFSFHFIADFHHHFGHFDFVAADIRYVYFFRRCRSRCCRRSRFFLLFCRSRRSSCCTFGGIENHNQFASLGFVADRDLDLFHDASLRRRDFHRGFVAFYGDQRLFSFNFVAHFDQNLGDFNFICPDVRYFDFDSHYSFTSYARRGLTLSASMLNLVIASATTFLSISPRLASSPSAATTT
ncbi:hypothetical protein SARI_02840 [Salmonella enterica subsp. arizonae serovar 62:z4,z23:-]|uniref:Uncharacterized protein n=1 Tax=Salmonella arizonae (strain ATCC BAA-731 / CDC346-86 / RSK2980) TaxID=41514 RepID=A9MQ90_SALAR|nr:hypothetical protein SARI_02840 [Salmonella enterica subsp. arizonae serovar 62:z4,z23:-]